MEEKQKLLISPRMVFFAFSDGNIGHTAIPIEFKDFFPSIEAARSTAMLRSPMDNLPSFEKSIQMM